MYNKLGRMKLALHISGFQHKCGWNNLGYDYTIQYNKIQYNSFTSDTEPTN